MDLHRNDRALSSPLPFDVIGLERLSQNTCLSIKNLQPSKEKMIVFPADLACPTEMPENVANNLGRYLEVLTQHKRWNKFLLRSRNARTNSYRCDRVPLYGSDLIKYLTLPSRQVIFNYLSQRSMALPNKSSEFLKLDGVHSQDRLVMNTTQRVKHFTFHIQKFAFITPAARHRGIVAVSSGGNHYEGIFLEKATKLTQKASKDKFRLCRPMDSKMEMFFPDRRLLQFDCGKLQALDRLLKKLKEGGHKCLIFSQMTRMLDILESFLSMHDHTYLRLDGSTKVDERQQLMEKFNRSDKYFCFILSTRSGGLGINLVGADTVIFYDTDWNPAMDAQAQDRAHRIGQTRDVHIYRLITEHSVEENILLKSNQKRHLNQLSLEDGQFTAGFFQKGNLRDILATGSSVAASALASKDVANSEQDQEVKDQEEPMDIDGVEESKEQENDDENNSNNNEKTNSDSKAKEEMSAKEIEEAMQSVEDDSDRAAFKRARQEAIEENDEFDEDSGNTPAADQLEKIEQMEQNLNPMNRHCVHHREVIEPDEELVNLVEASRELMVEGNAEWELEQIASIQEEEERRMGMDADLLIASDVDLPRCKEIYLQQQRFVQREHLKRVMCGMYWRMVIDEKSGRVYYNNVSSNSNVWVKPKVLIRRDQMDRAKHLRWAGIPPNVINQICSNVTSVDRNMMRASCSQWKEAINPEKYFLKVSLDGGNNVQNCYGSLRDALETANHGDTIKICQGVYFDEKPLIVRKRVRIIGNGLPAGHDIIHMTDDGPCLEDGSQISGKHADRNFSGTRIICPQLIWECSGGLLQGIELVGSEGGLCVPSKCKAVVVGCKLTHTKNGSRSGILVNRDASLFINSSIITRCRGSGILAKRAKRIMCIDSTISRNAGHGIALHHSPAIVLTSKIHSNDEIGILTFGDSCVKLEGNLMYKNKNAWDFNVRAPSIDTINFYNSKYGTKSRKRSRPGTPSIQQINQQQHQQQLYSNQASIYCVNNVLRDGSFNKTQFVDHLRSRLSHRFKGRLVSVPGNLWKKPIKFDESEILENSKKVLFSKQSLVKAIKEAALLMPEKDEPMTTRLRKPDERKATVLDPQLVSSATVPIKRKRGRPKKSATNSSSNDDDEYNGSSIENQLQKQLQLQQSQTVPSKRRRGRPARAAAVKAAAAVSQSSRTPPSSPETSSPVMTKAKTTTDLAKPPPAKKKKRGRPRKNPEKPQTVPQFSVPSGPLPLTPNMTHAIDYASQLASVPIHPDYRNTFAICQQDALKIGVAAAWNQHWNALSRGAGRTAVNASGGNEQQQNNLYYGLVDHARQQFSQLLRQQQQAYSQMVLQQQQQHQQQQQQQQQQTPPPKQRRASHAMMVPQHSKILMSSGSDAIGGGSPLFTLSPPPKENASNQFFHGQSQTLIPTPFISPQSDDEDDIEGASNGEVLSPFSDGVDEDYFDIPSNASAFRSFDDYDTPTRQSFTSEYNSYDHISNNSGSNQPPSASSTRSRNLVPHQTHQHQTTHPTRPNYHHHKNFQQQPSRLQHEQPIQYQSVQQFQPSQIYDSTTRQHQQYHSHDQLPIHMEHNRGVRELQPPPNGRFLRSNEPSYPNRPPSISTSQFPSSRNLNPDGGRRTIHL
eukprot:TRINITY_DN664_c0_g2_i4.p1 TRINITY_DN664_c0_g2~~TRINITY_DN664_c0_g2_i4.p1  ORF type:complete len:1873 (+),score=642.34 TRINITY_DN664_c0_g2_i4:766-5619(+)